MTVTSGGTAISGWTVRWTLSNGQTISQVWKGTLSVSGTTASVRGVSYNGSLPTGGSATFGFIGTGAASTPALTCTSS